MQYLFYFLYAGILPLSLIKRDRNARELYIVSAWIFIVFSIFLFSTNTTGTDYLNYKYIFNSIPIITSFSMKGHTELGFQLLISIVKTFGLGYTQFLFIFQSILAFLIIKSYKQVTPYWILALWLYFPKYVMQGHLNQIRIVVVYATMIFAIPLIKNNKLFLYIRNAIVSAFFHISGVIIIPVYLYFKSKSDRKISILLVLISMVLGQLIFIVLFRIASSYSIRGAKYILDGAGETSSFSLTVIRRMILFCYGLLIYPYAKRNQPYFNVIWNIFVASVCFYFMFMKMPILAERIGAIFSVVEPLIIISVIYVLKPESRIWGYLFILFYGLSDVILRGLLPYSL
ncbi:MAG: EpsG family protein [Spirochaetales bacterium]|uniref:EpsG family protein n=1 Tax=Candidatus Thalassospirochaeta sargassi TaxID=3119039 RepID=A0AAJ1IE27_9SPIO|nr:EpsG family protein [Spirochaetales bacterium]